MGLRRQLLTLLVLALAVLAGAARALAAGGDPIVLAEDTKGTPGNFFRAIYRVPSDGTPEQLTAGNAMPTGSALAFTGPDSVVTVGFKTLGRFTLSSRQLVNVTANEAGDMRGIALAPDGSLVATDFGATGGTAADGRVLRIDPLTGSATTISSAGLLVNPLGIAIAENGAIFVSNSDGAGHAQVIEVDPVGGAQRVVTSGPLVAPWGIAFLADGELVVADESYNHAFRGALVRIDPVTGAQTPRFLEKLSGPIETATAVAVDDAGEVLVTERNSGQIDRVNLETGVAQQVAQSIPGPLGVGLEPGVAPTTVFLSGPSGTTRNTTPKFTFSPSQYGAQSSCLLDRGPAVPCQRSFTTPPLAPGPHSLRVNSTIFGARGPDAVRNFTVDPTALDTLITSGPSGPTNVTSPTFAFEAPGGGTSFTCSIDGAAQSPCESPFTVAAPLPDGPHSFNVRADGDPTGDTRSFTVDTAPPHTAITSGPNEGASTSATQPTFTFSSSEEPPSFLCTLDGAAVLCGSVFTPELALAEGPHTLIVRAVDAAGNPDPAPVTRHFTVDTTPPVTTITGGPTGTTDVATPTFTFTASEGGVLFSCGLDAAPLTPCDSPFTVAPALADGPHAFRVRATDAAGNVEAVVREREFTVDASVPETSITAGPSALTNDSSPTFEFESTKAGSTFACVLDGGDAVACESPFQAQSLDDGAHTFAVTATDALGHPDPTPATRTFAVDTVAPQTTLGAGPGALTNDRTPDFAFASEAGATFSCRIDGGAATACASPFTAPPLADGPHTVRVTATDAAGNVEAAPPQFAFTVDTVAPSTTIDTGPAGDTTDTQPTFSFSAEETATFACSLDAAAPVACEHTFRPAAPLALGAHTLTVVATDAAGNPDPSPAQRAFRVVAKEEPPKEEPPKEEPKPIATSLKLRVSLRKHTLHVQATVSPAGTGAVAVAVTGRAGRRQLRRHITIGLRAGTGSAGLRLPNAVTRVRLAASYGGDGTHAASSATATVRGRRR